MKRTLKLDLADDGLPTTATGERLRRDLAALPEPMTERDIQVLICGILQKGGTAIDITRALKSHNVLFVKE